MFLEILVGTHDSKIADDFKSKNVKKKWDTNTRGSREF